MNTPTLVTKRLILRRFTENDMEALYVILSDREANRFLPWFPTASLQEARQFYEERYVPIYSEPQGYMYAVCLKEDNIPIGYIDIDAKDPHELGFGLRTEYWHRGITIEAAKAVVAQAKRDGIPSIIATHDIHNPRSGNVMKSLGMTYHHSYEELWQPKGSTVTFCLYRMDL